MYYDKKLQKRSDLFCNFCQVAVSNAGKKLTQKKKG